MKRIFLLVIVFCSIQVGGFSESFVLSDLIYPQLIKVGRDNIYIVDKEKVYVYSLNPIKKMNTFGKLGEGPEEFRVHPGTPIMLSLTKKNLIAETGGSIYYYDKNGKYIKEQKVLKQFMASIKPVGENFVGLCYGNHNKIRQMKIKLIDNQFTDIKELVSAPDEKQPKQGMDFLAIPQQLYTCYAVEKNQIYTSVGKNMSIKVFDAAGKQLRIISKDYNNLKVSNEFKSKIIKHFRTDPFLKQFFQYLSPISFPSYFPAIRDLRVADDKIYAITYKMKDNKSEVLIFKTNGDYLRTVFLPIQEQNSRFFYPYDIKNNQLYQVVEKDEENFELKIFAF